MLSATKLLGLTWVRGPVVSLAGKACHQRAKDPKTAPFLTPCLKSQVGISSPESSNPDFASTYQLSDCDFLYSTSWLKCNLDRDFYFLDLKLSPLPTIQALRLRLNSRQVSVDTLMALGVRIRPLAAGFESPGLPYDARVSLCFVC